ncbi:hypothetical protein NDN08_005536 [Rhodosorus marinus]|uniref:Protein phosphatase n=1 Tax=Rhodosorus marinus TaxID=101924 RepID=A0AAV8V4W3_9RHOD|nr:hypothetical protein NDN08_005536 [Rhodosorus marinus]
MRALGFAGCGLLRLSGYGGAPKHRAAIQPRRLLVTASTAEYESTPPAAKSWKLETAVSNLPHPEKLEKGGEDAFFVLETAMGVFDGVGGWASQGIDPGLYSRKLSKLTEEQIKEGKDLAEALDHAHKNNDLQGSTTACIASILPGGKIALLNVGDSGLIAIRPSQGIYFKTPDQQHYFNCPFQLGSTYEDKVKDGIAGEIPVQSGDYLILATDGLLDNLHDIELEQIVKDLDKEKSGRDALKAIADTLSIRAQTLAVEEKYWSPFAMNASKYGYSTLGGKLDDITLIAARAVSS